MITAGEIRNQQFEKSLRGYDTGQVNNYLLQVANDYEKLYSDVATLRETVQRLEYELQKYRRIEETMNNSLILAQQTADELKTNARHESTLILQQSKGKIAEVFMVYQELIKRMGVYSSEMKAQIAAQMEMMEKNQKRIDELSDFFFGRDLKEILERLESISLKEE
ncbi:MAG: DivIVA domain-containing protein [Deltaproteobacteria bacterium]